MLSKLYDCLIQARIELGEAEMATTEFEQAQKKVEAALEDINRVLRQSGRPEIRTKKSIRLVEVPYAKV